MQVTDIRGYLLRDHSGGEVEAVVTPESPGVLSGMGRVFDLAGELGLSARTDFRDGDRFAAGAELVRISGSPAAVIRSEEPIIGTLSKPCGIATAARFTREMAGPNLRVVSGGSKKMPCEIRDHVRQAVQDGGLDVRMLPCKFVYLDKNYVRILGGVGPALRTARGLDRLPVIQVRGERASLEEEAVEAARGGAAVIMVDTGKRQDLRKVSEALHRSGLRAGVKIAFAGCIKLNDIKELKHEDVDVLDIGYAILDAPCIPIRFDVLSS